MFDLTGKKALITGSSQGIGFALAKTLTEYGAKVFIHGSDKEKCENAAKEINNSVAVVSDLGNNTAAEEIYKLTGDVDILILNASVQFRTPWNEIGDEEFDKQIQVNLKSSLKLMQKYFPKMKENKFGRIITIGSVQQYKPHKDMAIYAASKCSQMSLVKNIAKQVAPFGITVNNISPGVIATPRNEKALSDINYSRLVMAGIPLGYAGKAEDISGAALLLCGDAGRYITGTDIIIDGGMSL